MRKLKIKKSVQEIAKLNSSDEKFIFSNICRSSPSAVFLGKGVLKICNKFTGEHPWWSVILIKLFWNFIEIALQHGCSPAYLQHIFRTPFYKNTSARLLLYMQSTKFHLLNTHIKTLACKLLFSAINPMVWMKYFCNFSKRSTLNTSDRPTHCVIFFV